MTGVILISALVDKELKKVLQMQSEETNMLQRKISDQEMASKQIQFERDKIENLMDLSPVGILFIDPQGQIEFANGKFLEMTGLKMQELKALDIFHPYWDLRDIQGKPLRGDNHPFLDFQKGNKSASDIRFSFSKRGGGRGYITSNFTPIHDQGKLIGYLGVLNDVTKFLDLEQYLIEKESGYPADFQ